MENPLRVLVRIDTRNAAASIEVRGSLTGNSCGSLLNILHHTATLGADICVNLTRTARIEAAALEVLADAAGSIERSAPADEPLQVHIELPAGEGSLTGISAGRRRTLRQERMDGNGALNNEAALDMILHRDPRVLARLQNTVPRDKDVPAARGAVPL